MFEVKNQCYSLQAKERTRQVYGIYHVFCGYWYNRPRRNRYQPATAILCE